MVMLPDVFGPDSKVSPDASLAQPTGVQPVIPLLRKLTDEVGSICVGAPQPL